MMCAKKGLCIVLVFLLALPSIIAHSNILVDVSLDFDPALKADVLKKAAEFTGLEEKPLRFDYMFENIAVVYDRPLELSVQIHPVTLEVFGMRDDSLAKGAKGEEQFDSQERKAIAQKAFESIPKSYQEEFVYFGEKKGYTGAYRHLWVRMVDGIYSSNEMFEVEVNPMNGAIVSWRLTPFMHPKEDFITNPGFSAGVAEQIAVQFFENTELIVGEEPKLILEDQKPVWVVKIKGIYPFYVIIDALDGRVKYSGLPKTEVLATYDVGPQVAIIQSEDVRRALI